MVGRPGNEAWSKVGRDLEETLGSDNIYNLHIEGGRILYMSNHPVYLALHFNVHNT